jgi:glycosyltransferase involved in cell wall biosynthesis
MTASILYVHQDGELSGSAISLRGILGALDRARYRPRVLLGRDGPARKLFEELDVPVDVVPTRGFWTAPPYPWFEPDYHRNWPALLPNRSLDQYLASQRPHLIHINDKAMLAAGMSAARVGVPIVWHLRSSYEGGHSRLQPAVSRFIIRRTAAHLISISEDEIDGFEDLANLDVIYNGVDMGAADAAQARRDAVRRELGLQPSDVAVGMVGLLSKTKGAWDFIEASGLARAQAPNVSFRFFAIAPIPSREPRPPALRERLGLLDTTHPADRANALAFRAGIADRFVLTGRRSDVLAVLAAMDIACVCYRLPAVGRPAFEGMAVGCPVIVNPGHSGRSGIVRSSDTGFVVSPDDHRGLAAAMVRLASHAELRHTMGERGRAHARMHFDLRRNVSRIQEVYERVLS